MPKNRWARPLINPYIIRMDSAGSGRFGASRSGGTRTHKGVDFLAVPGEPVLSPISGVVNRQLQVYTNDPDYIGCEITGTGAFQGYKVKLFYMVPTSVGDTVQRGQIIGYMQNIAAKYGGSMQPHLHFEVYKNNVLINPETLYKDLKAQQ